MTDASRLKATVYVGGLDNAVTGPTLHSAFIPFGEIVDVSLPKPEAPSSKDPHRGFGYVEFEVAGDAKEAIDNMDQAELFGRVIKVSVRRIAWLESRTRTRSLMEEPEIPCKDSRAWTWQARKLRR